jgi:proteic killer suppression protein
LRPLKGNRKGVWAMTVRANWRVNFRFEGGDAYNADLKIPSGETMLCR